jgi:hypothetical protein
VNYNRVLKVAIGKDGIASGVKLRKLVLDLLLSLLLLALFLLSSLLISFLR